MAFELLWTREARARFDELGAMAERAARKRRPDHPSKAGKQPGLFRQVVKCLDLLADNPRHPGLHTHPYHSIDNPYDAKQKVFEAYVQDRTRGAYRLFWCHGPGRNQITVIAITPHP
jgi:hypothetical protein